MGIDEQLKRAARDSGHSIKRLAELADVHYSGMHRFYTTGGGITLTTAAKLAKVLGLELRQVRKPKARRR